MFANLKAYKPIFGCLNVYASLSEVLCAMYILFQVLPVLIYVKPSFYRLFKPFPQRLMWLGLLNINYFVYLV